MPRTRLPRLRSARRRTRLVPIALGVLIGLAAFGLYRVLVHRTVTVRCPNQTVAELTQESPLIVTGTVFAVIPGAPYAQVLITPTRVYRDAVPARGITVLANATAANANGSPTGDLHFTSADPPYLLFLRDHGDGTYTTSRCYGSRTLGAGLTLDESTVLGVGQPTTR